MEDLKFEYQGKKLVSAFGRQRLEIEYVVTHTNGNKEDNRYNVICELRGYDMLVPEVELSVYDVTPFEENKNSLSTGNIIDLIQEALYE